MRVIQNIRHNAVAGIFIICSLLFLLVMTWGKHGSLVIDTFRDIIITSQILNGAMLYNGIFYEYGPLPPYLMALACSITGIKLSTFALIGASSCLISVIFIYNISRIYLRVYVSAFVGTVFLFVFAFGFYRYDAIFNYILPYSFASTLCMTFLLIALYFFLMFLITAGRSYITGWFIFMTAASLCRLDLFIPCYLSLAFVLIFLPAGKDMSRKSNILYAFIPALSTIALYCLFLAATGTLGSFSAGLFKLISSNSNSPFLSILIGLNNLGVNLMDMLISSIFIFSIMGCITAGLVFIFNGSKQTIRLITGAALSILAFYLAYRFIASEYQYRCIPVILTIGSIFALINIIQKRKVTKNICLLSLYLFSLACVSRILFAVSPASYGFFLCAPAVIAYYTFVFNSFIHFVSPPKRNLAYSIMIVLFIFINMPYCLASYSQYQKKGLSIETPVGTITCWDDNTTRAIAEAATYIRDNTTAADCVVAVPEGACINILSERPSRFKYSSLPPNIVTSQGEDMILAELIKSDPKMIAFLARNSSEQGAAYFGDSYCNKTYKWILDNYDYVHQLGPYPFTSKEFGIAIFKKKQIP